MNKWSRAIKIISGKRVKSDADYEEMARLEFMAGLYLAPEGPIIPNNVFDGMMLKAAQKSKEGPMAKSSVFCLSHARLDYDGPREPDVMWQEECFRFPRIVKVGTARVVRMRPKFDEWSCIVEVSAETTLINPGRIDEWMNVAGSQVGLCDWRPQYGRFHAERIP
jgi:hypothetical protein